MSGNHVGKTGTRVIVTILSILAVAVSPPALGENANLPMDAGTGMVIDDFSRGNGVSLLGTRWRLVTDRVMGGVSEASHAVEVKEGSHFIHLTGNVSLENRGGFVQVALPLTSGGGFFDAGEFEGIEIRVRGNEETYSVHLRGRQTTLPWQFFSADFHAGHEWKTVRIPFSAFVSENMREATLDRSRLKRIGIVAANRAFQADVSVSYVGLYR